jgi:PAS domain S-box-containing protein
VINPVSEASHPRTPAQVFQAAVEACPIALAVLEADGAIALCNSELERLLGYGRSELLGMMLDALLPDLTPSTYADLRGDVRPAVPRRQVRELRGRRKDGSELLAEVTLTTMPVQGAAMILVSIADRRDRRSHTAESDAALQERLALEGLTAEFGPDFVDIAAEDVGRRVDALLGQLGRMLDVDQVGVVRILDDRGDFEPAHQWVRPGIVAPRRRFTAREQLPWHFTHLTAGELVSFAAVEDVPHPADREFLRRDATKSGVAVPLRVGGRVWGALMVATSTRSRVWTPMLLGRLGVLAAIIGAAFARRDADAELRRTVIELRVSHDRLRDEAAYLREEIDSTGVPPTLVAHSPPMRRALEQARHAATLSTPVLFVGDRGTGRSTLARHVHALSARRQRALIRINAAISSAAVERRLAVAEQSTIFVDDVAELAPELQAVVAQAIADADVRVMAATRVNLGQRVTAGRFRDDLYRRLAASTIAVAPLRDRPEDVPPLVWRFVDEFATTYGRPIDAIGNDAMTMLERYPWPGNVGELRAVIDRAMVTGSGRHLLIESLSSPQQRPPAARRGRR